MNLEQIELRFRELFNSNDKLNSVKEFKDLTGLGLREAKEFIDNKWSYTLGISVQMYLLKTKGYVFIVDNVTFKDFGVQIQISKGINESQIDELIEKLTIKIAELKGEK